MTFKLYWMRTSLNHEKNCHTAGKGSHGTPNIAALDCNSALSLWWNATYALQGLHSSTDSSTTGSGLPSWKGSYCASFRLGDVEKILFRAHLSISLPSEPPANTPSGRCCFSGRTLPHHERFPVQTQQTSESTMLPLPSPSCLSTLDWWPHCSSIVRGK